MQQNITANKWVRLLAFAFIVSYLYVISRSVHLRGYDDDQFFLAIFNSGEMLKRAFERYFTWTGRVTIELLMTSTIGYPSVWKIGIPASVLLLCFSISRIAFGKARLVQVGMVVLLFASIPSAINDDSSWWVTGFYNYLLPVSLAFYAFSVSYLGIERYTERLMCIISVFVFSYMEQAGIVYIISLLLLIFLCKRSRNTFNIFILSLSVVNFVVCIKAPGNENRMLLETWSWYPQYQAYGVINKLSLGFDKLHNLMTMSNNIPLIFLCSIVVYVQSLRNDNSLALRASMFVLITFIALSLVNSFTGFFYNKSFFFHYYLSSSNWSSAKIYISYFYFFVVISSMFTIFIDMVSRSEKMILAPIMLLLGFMTVTMMGMTPTVYASGLRVDFIFECMCIASGCYIIKSISAN
ncbi:hypothetical protein [Pantoea septica]|uniref:hypothetical protein n=1 Tax=Pantoea septica TaxID=472695 RepID=UPI003D0758F5